MNFRHLIRNRDKKSNSKATHQRHVDFTNLLFFATTTLSPTPLQGSWSGSFKRTFFDVQKKKKGIWQMGYDNFLWAQWNKHFHKTISDCTNCFECYKYIWFSLFSTNNMLFTVANKGHWTRKLWLFFIDVRNFTLRHHLLWIDATYGVTLLVSNSLKNWHSCQKWKNLSSKANSEAIVQVDIE